MKKLLTITAACLAFNGAMAAPAFGAGDHLITMQEADIRAFIDDVSVVTGKTFLVDPRVQGKVTISSEQSLNPKEVFDVFKNVMRVHNFAVTRTSSGEYRISLMQGAAQDAPFVERFGYNSQLATTVIPLNYTDAANAAKLIKPMMHAQGVLTANPGGNIIVITDFPENIRKARAIIDKLDTDGRTMETVTLTHMTAGDAEKAIRDLAGPRPAYKIVGLTGSNAVALEGPAADVAKIKDLLRRMDMPGRAMGGNVAVIPLRYADGTGLVEILTNLIPAYAVEGQPAPTVAHEIGTNTIIVSAPPEARQAMEQIIRRLDVRRPQVLVEAIIVEISDSAAKELGVQFAVSGINNSSVPFFGTNFSRQAVNVLALTGALAGNNAGLPSSSVTTLQTAAVNSLTGTTGAAFGGAGRSGDTVFSAIASALETDADTNILSTPFVTTLDNVPAKFLVGQQIPVTTGETLGTNNANPFRTFEREEVGIKLEVTPQISEGDVIRLQIAQEVSSIAGALTAATNGNFITNKRSIETTVLADDGEIIVLGGLIQDDEQFNLEKIPVLGDAPIVGNLFRAKGNTHTKTNLMVFLRPTIIRSGADARPLTDERLNYMRRQEMNQSGRTISKIDTVLTDR